MLSALLVALSVLLQTPEWVIHIYDLDNEVVYAIDSEGNLVNEYTLYQPDIYEVDFRERFEVAMSPDGRLMAYVPTSNITDKRHFIVYDLFEAEALINLPLPDGFEISLNRRAGAAFPIDNSAVVFSLTEERGDRWSIWRVPLDEGVLPRVDPLFTGEDVPTRRTDPVDIILVDGEDIYFNQGIFRFDGYLWQDGTITPIDFLPTAPTSILPQARAGVSALEDERFESTFTYLGLGDPNYVVIHWSEESGQTIPIYTAPNIQIWGVYFIENGEKILLNIEEEDEEGNNPQDKLRVLNMDGDVLTDLEIDRASNITNVPDGFIYSGGFRGELTLMYVNTTTEDYKPELLYELPEGPPGGDGVRFLWAGIPGEVPEAMTLPQPQSSLEVPSPAPEDLPTATPVPNLPPPTIAPTPTLIPLVIGAEVEIFLPRDDELNIREEPSTAFPVVTMVNDGDVVTLLEGPLNVEGLSWWRVETEDGQVGWLVDGVIEGGVYLPTLLYPGER